MSSPWHLGNDIVDLTDPRHVGKARDRRFLERVFSPREQEEIRNADDPDRALWARWAGKEAAFKTVSKSLGIPPTFVHPRFAVCLSDPSDSEPEAGSPSDPPMTRFGQVQYGDTVLPLRIETRGPQLHAVTWISQPSRDVPPFKWGSEEVAERRGEWKAALQPEFSPTEWACVSHEMSALARLAARRSMASALGVGERELEIGCGPGKPGRRIPRVLSGGEPLPVDLTLSHHGRLLAWAFLLPRQP
jgi:phosphopantetheine--protein transferase-like protein